MISVTPWIFAVWRGRVLLLRMYQRIERVRRAVECWAANVKANPSGSAFIVISLSLVDRDVIDCHALLTGFMLRPQVIRPPG